LIYTLKHDLNRNEQKSGETPPSLRDTSPCDGRLGAISLPPLKGEVPSADGGGVAFGFCSSLHNLRESERLFMSSDKKTTAIIMSVILLSVVILSFVVEHIYSFRSMVSDVLNQLFVMFIYAVIACLPAVILRAKFGLRALKWIVIAATVLGGLCCFIHIVMPETKVDKFDALEYVLLPEDVLEDFKAAYPDTVIEEIEPVSNNSFWIFAFTQFALTSAVPALYCVAFVGELYSFPFFGKRKSILIALAPSFMFGLSLVIRHAMIRDFGVTLAFIFDESILVVMLSSAVYAVWALLLIFISHMIYKFINRMKIKN